MSLARCPDAEPLAEADIDGDGVLEDVMITERDAGQALWVSGRDGGLSVELEYAVWYLAVTDLEPDGVDEVFLGAARGDDAPGVVSTKLHWIEPVEDGLAPRVADYVGVGIGPTFGAGCVDVDRDGDRELVQVYADTELSTDTTVAWHRQVSDAITFDGDLRAADGEFTVGRDDEAISLLSTFSCGDELVELIRVRPPAAICTADSLVSSESPLAVDLDGDGLDDLVNQRGRTPPRS